jgi:DNA-binding XRE family transcriptional regulator
MFGLCERPAMEIAALRKELGLSQEAFAPLIGLGSKSHVCALENGVKPSVRVALAIERVSGGRISAADLNEDVALVRAALPANDSQPQERAA